jgi:trimeric autotransporter adhesin
MIIITANYSLTSTLYNAFGIRITGGTNHKVYFNNVHLFGPVTAMTSNGMSAAFIVTSNTATGLDVRNNIFSNTTQFLNGAASKSYAAYVVTGTAFANINYNNYFSGGPSALFGFYGADKTDLAAWQASSGQDANSQNRNPQFASDTDLTPSNPYLNASADATVPYYTDFNGVTRSTPPDFGAIEFTPPLCPDPSVCSQPQISHPTTGRSGLDSGFLRNTVECSGVSCRRSFRR